MRKKGGFQPILSVWHEQGDEADMLTLTMTGEVTKQGADKIWSTYVEAIESWFRKPWAKRKRQGKMWMRGVLPPRGKKGHVLMAILFPWPEGVEEANIDRLGFLFSHRLRERQRFNLAGMVSNGLHQAAMLTREEDDKPN